MKKEEPGYIVKFFNFIFEPKEEEEKIQRPH